MWEQVVEELSQRLLAVVDLDDRDRPAARKIREQRAKDAGYLLVYLERMAHETGWWAQCRRTRLARQYSRALRRSAAADDPKQATLVAQTAEGMREVWAELDRYWEAPAEWAARNAWRCSPITGGSPEETPAPRVETWRR
jgi:photosystem II stability/assembly factor-like uncharacterized protein